MEPRFGGVTSAWLRSQAADHGARTESIIDVTAKQVTRRRGSTNSSPTKVSAYWDFDATAVESFLADLREDGRQTNKQSL
jgi:hypothetical protein